MPNYSLNPEDCYYFLEQQIHNPVPESFELLPALRVRFGNLLREDIVSVRLEYASGSYLIAVTSVGNELVRRQIDAFVPERLLKIDLFDPPKLNRLLPIIASWIEALDGIAAAREFELFTPHALAFIERVSSNLKDSAYESAQKSMQFNACLAKDMGMEFAPAILKKVEAVVRAEYQSNPANDMAGEYPQNEWQELGAMLYDSSHVLLNVGIEQLQGAIYSEIRALSDAEKLALWFGHCEELGEWLEGRTLEDDFNVLQDTDTFDRLRESLFDDLKYAMQRDWEKKLHEIENALEDNE